MTDGRRSVNDIWQELQKSAAIKAGLSGFGGFSYNFQGTETKKDFAKPPSFIGSLQAKTGSTISTESASVSVQRDVNCLLDKDRRTRIKAMENISSKLIGLPKCPDSDTELQLAFEGALLVPLVRLFADPTEKCRELAVNCVTAAIERMTDVSKILSVLVSALVERMGILPVEERSEEIRLALVKLVNAVIKFHSASIMEHGSLQGIIEVLCRGMEDAYPENKKVASATVADLVHSSKYSNTLLEPNFVTILSSLLPNLKHQHSKVRLAALDSLEALVMAGCGYELLVERVAPAVLPLVHEHAPSVRLKLVRCTARWMGSTLCLADNHQLADQARACVPLFLPSLLTAQLDELAIIREEAVQHVQYVAVFYRQMQPQHPDGEDDHRMQIELDEENWQYQGQSIGSLPGYCHPYMKRPSYAAREMVKVELPRLIPLVSQGTQEWTVPLRLAAARLLHALLIYAEGKAMQYLPEILQSLQRGVADNEAIVAQQVAVAAHVLAMHVGPSHWIPFVLENITAAHLNITQRNKGLKLLSILMEAAGRAGQPAEQEAVQLVACTLLHGELISINQEELEANLLRAASHLLIWGNKSCSPVARHLLHLLLRIMAAERTRIAAAETAAHLGPQLGVAPIGGTVPLFNTATSSITPLRVITRLATTCNAASVQSLCNQLAPQLLCEICHDYVGWHGETPQWHVFNSLLRCCGSEALIAETGTIIAVLCAIGPDGDVSLRVSACEMLQDIFQDVTKRAAWQRGLAALIVEKAVLPAMMWRAGIGAATVRYAALKALQTALAKQLLANEDMMQLIQQAGLLPVLYQCLDEDYLAEMRLDACSAIRNLLQQVGCNLETEELVEVQQELLKRLDDSNDTIRVAACHTLVQLHPWLSAHPSLLEKNALRALACKVLVHMDDENLEVQEAACNVLQSLAALAPEVIQECAHAAKGVHRSTIYLEKVLAAC